MRAKRCAIPVSARRLLLAGLALCAAGRTSLVLASGATVLPVPTITIYPGDVIKDEWLVDRDFPPGISAAAMGTRAAIVGKVARRTLLPGSPVPWNAVVDPRVVANGTKVRLQFEEGALAITAYGTALQAGGAGDVISVRNLASGLMISGTVQADGSVRVGGN